MQIYHGKQKFLIVHKIRKFKRDIYFIKPIIETKWCTSYSVVFILKYSLKCVNLSLLSNQLKPFSRKKDVFKRSKRWNISQRYAVEFRYQEWMESENGGRLLVNIKRDYPNWTTFETFFKEDFCTVNSKVNIINMFSLGKGVGISHIPQRYFKRIPSFLNIE